MIANSRLHVPLHACCPPLPRPVTIVCALNGFFFTSVETEWKCHCFLFGCYFISGETLVPVLLSIMVMTGL